MSEEPNGIGDRALGKWTRIAIYVVGGALMVGSPIVCTIDRVASAESKADKALTKCEESERSLTRIENKVDKIMDIMMRPK